MNSLRKLLLGTLLVTSLQVLLTGCSTEGYIGMSNGVYYGPHRDPWFRDDPWMDGHRWYRGSGPDTTIGIYLHPPRHGR